MTFFATDRQPLTPGTPEYTNAVIEHTAKVAYVKQERRRRNRVRANRNNRSSTNAVS